MSNVVANNLMSMNAQRNLNNNTMGLSTAMERLSSGLRVNTAKDDAAGLAVAERMSAQARGMNVAIRNASDAVSMVRTADGGLQQISDTLQRMRELAVQSANGTYEAADRDLLQKEFAELNNELERISEVTKFNGKTLLAGGAEQTTFQVGANTGADDRINVAFADILTGAGMAALFVSTASVASADSVAAVVSTSTPSIPATPGTEAGRGATIAGAASEVSAIRAVIDNIDLAINEVNEQRATFGAAMNRFEATITNLRNASENQTAAMSRIMDADFAAETAALTRGQVLQQSGIAILAQANQAPQAVLGLLR